MQTHLKSVRKQKHAKSARRSRTRRAAAKPAAPRPVAFSEAPPETGGFMQLLLQRLSWTQLNGLQLRKHAAGRPAHELSRGQLLAALLFHYTIRFAGSFAEHLFWLLGIPLAESTLSERRQALPFEVFQELLRLVLRPIGHASAEAFYRSWRLVGLDGVNWSLPNTSQVTEKCRKGGNQKGRAAFAKLTCAVLVELIMHNPWAACLGRDGQSEWKLALGLLDQLPAGCLLLADRLYGCGAFLVNAARRLEPKGGHFLVRVKQRLKIVRCLQRLADGSRLVEIHALDPADPHRVVATLRVREIQATLQRRGHRSVTVRLWTSLLDPTQAPALELIHLYASRWEQELYFRELKATVGINDLLRSQTVETAAQEVVAMIIGSSLIAHERAQLKPGKSPAHLLSCFKVQELLQPLWLTFLLGADILTPAQMQQLTRRFYDLCARQAMPKKRIRSCPRALRQPIQPWPRKRNQPSSTEPTEISIVTGT
jgi:hypothetical protein